MYYKRRRIGKEARNKWTCDSNICLRNDREKDRLEDVQQIRESLLCRIGLCSR